MRRNFIAIPGKKNGLYWETKAGEEPSPLGELVVQARAGGYQKMGKTQKPMPFQGYYFRMLGSRARMLPEERTIMS